jgi:hypothetical protein
MSRRIVLFWSGLTLAAPTRIFAAAPPQLMANMFKTRQNEY